MSTLTLVLGRSDAFWGGGRSRREKQVRRGQRRLACSRETELMKWCQYATSRATNEAAARESMAKESAEGSVLMRSIQEGETGLLPLQWGSHCTHIGLIPVKRSHVKFSGRPARTDLDWHSILKPQSCSIKSALIKIKPVLTPWSERLSSMKYSRGFSTLNWR